MAPRSGAFAFVLGFLLLFSASQASANVRRVSRQSGDFTINVLYADAPAGTNTTLQFVRFDAATATLWFISTWTDPALSIAPSSTTVGCRLVSQRRVVVGPEGCSNFRAP